MANEVTIVVTGRDTGAKQTITATTRETDKLGKSVTRIAENVQGIIAAQMFQQIGQSATRFLGQARNASSDLGESVNAVSQVFGDQSSTVLKWGRDNATAFGLSERAFNQAVTPMGAVLRNTGMSMDDVTRNTIDLTKRASDMASVFNTDVGVALDAIGSGLRGETEPLRQFGVTLTAAAIQARALADSGKDSAAALTEQEKAAARVAIIFEQTESVAGDFANTSDQLANSQRILAAEFETAQAIVGTLMVPALEALNAVLVPLVQAFNDAPKSVQVVVGSLVLLGAGILTVTSRIAPMIIAMQAAGVSMGTLATKARVAALAMGPVVAIITLVTTVLALMGRKSTETGNDITGLAKDLQRLVDGGRVTVEMQRLFGDSTEDLTDKINVASGSAHNLGGAVERLKQAWGGIIPGVETARDDFIDLDNAMVAVVASGTDADAVLQGMVTTYGLTDEQVQRLLELLPKFQTELDRSAEAARDEATTHTKAASAAHDQMVALEDLEDALKAQADPMFALIKAQQDLKEKQDAYTEAVKEFGRKSPEAEDALLALAEAGVDVASASARAAGTFDGRLTPSMQAALRAAGLTQGQIDAIAAAAERARQKLERFEGSYRADVQVHTRFTSSGTPPPGGSRPKIFFDAHGGTVGGIGAARGMQTGGVSGGALGLVGEQGPELVDLPFGTRVIPSGQTQAILAAGAGGQRVQLEVVAVGSGDDLMDAIIRQLSFRVRTQAAGSVNTLLGAL